ncbi:MAG: glycosyltransferase [Planctomycetota bacterium]
MTKALSRYRLFPSPRNLQLPSLTVILPAFNERLRLPRTLTLLSEWARSQPFEVEILVVDDGSDDATAAMAASHQADCRVIRLHRNSGKGAAVRLGMLAAEGDIVAFTDSDLPYRLESLSEAHAMIAGREAEVVYGARDLPDSKDVSGRNASRALASACFRKITSILVPCGVLDTQCGLKVYSANAARAVFSRVHTDGFAFDAEAILVAHKLGIGTAKVAVTLVNEAGSTVSLRRHAPAMLRDLLLARLRHGWEAGPAGAAVPDFDTLRNLRPDHFLAVASFTRRRARMSA